MVRTRDVEKERGREGPLGRVRTDEKTTHSRVKAHACNVIRGGGAREENGITKLVGE